MPLHCKTIFSGHSGPVYALALESDTHFFSAGSDGIIAHWNSQEPEHAVALAQLKEAVYALHFFREKNHLLVGTASGNIHVIDMESKKEIRHLLLELNGVFSIQVINDIIWVLGGNGTLFAFDVEWNTLAQLSISEFKLRSLVLHQNKMYVGDSAGQVFIINPQNFQIEKSFMAHQPSVYALISDGDFLYSSGRDGHIRKWDSNNALVWEIPAHNYAIYSLSFWGEKIVSSSRDRKVKMWTKEGAFIDKTKPELAFIGSINNSMILGNQIIACSDDKKIKIFELKES